MIVRIRVGVQEGLAYRGEAGLFCCAEHPTTIDACVFGQRADRHTQNRNMPPSGNHTASAGGCKPDGQGSTPLPAQLELLAPVIVVIVGVVLTFNADRLWHFGRNHPRLKSLQPSRLFPRLAVWLDLSFLEIASVIIYSVCTGLPVVLAGVSSASLVTTARLAGTTTVIALACLVVPATRTSLLVRVLGVHYDRALIFHKIIALWALMAMVRRSTRWVACVPPALGL